MAKSEPLSAAEILPSVIDRKSMRQLPLGSQTGETERDPNFAIFSKALMDMFATYPRWPKPSDNSYDGYWAALRPFLVSGKYKLLDIVNAIRLSPFFNQSYPLSAPEISSIFCNGYTQAEVIDASTTARATGTALSFDVVAQLINNNRKRKREAIESELRRRGLPPTSAPTTDWDSLVDADSAQAKELRARVVRGEMSQADYDRLRSIQLEELWSKRRATNEN